MNEILWLLELAMRDLQAARRRAGSKRVRAHIRLAIARLNEGSTASARNEEGSRPAASRGSHHAPARSLKPRAVAASIAAHSHAILRSISRRPLESTAPAVAPKSWR